MNLQTTRAIGPTQGETALLATPEAPAARRRRMQVFFEMDYEGAGPRFIVLASNRWPGFLRRYCGINSEPLFERDSLPHEADVFPNGHPFAWAYRCAHELVAEEARWLSPQALGDLNAAIDRAVAAGPARRPVEVPTSPAVSVAALAAEASFGAARAADLRPGAR